MDRNDKIAASARRAANLKVEATRCKAQAAMFDAAQRNILRSSINVQNVERACVAGYHEMCEAAAVAIAEIEGADAPQHASRITDRPAWLWSKDGCAKLVIGRRAATA
jgi:hypothetical protein